jgi:hypothetical protein
MVLYFYDSGRSLPTFRLDDMNLPALTLTFMQEREAAEADYDTAKVAWEAAIRRLIAGNLGTEIRSPGSAFARAVGRRALSHANILRTYATFQKQHVERSGDDEYRTFSEWLALVGEETWSGDAGPAAAPDRAGKAQFSIGAGSVDSLADALHQVIDRHGPPFQGIIHVANHRGPALVLDGTASRTERWSRFSGRLIVVVAGDCTVRNVRREDPERDMLTIVCQGKLGIGGRVEASLVARSRLARVPDAQGETVIVGNLLLEDRVFQDPDLPPERVLEQVVLVKDPRIASWSEREGNKLSHSSVILDPVPIYVSSPRAVTP